MNLEPTTVIARSRRLTILTAILALALILTPPARAAATDPLGLLQAACSATHAQVICDLAESAVFIQGLAQNGARQLIGTLTNIGNGFVQDAIQSLGSSACVGGVCLNDLTASLKNYLNTAPAEFFDRLYAEGQKYFLSNMNEKLYGPSSAQVHSPTYAAEQAIQSNPNVKAQYVNAAAQDLDAFKNKTEVGKLAAQAGAIIAPLPAGQFDPYQSHVNGLGTPKVGFIDGYKDRAKTNVSARETLQTLVELESDRAGLDAINTLEVSRRVQQVSSEQAITNAQLAKIYDALVADGERKAIQYQAELESKLSNAYDDASNASSLFSSAGDSIMDKTNPSFVLDFVDRF